MDPVTAFFQAITALAEMVTELSRGQTDAQKQAMWQWYVDDIKALRDLMKLKG